MVIIMTASFPHIVRSSNLVGYESTNFKKPVLPPGRNLEKKISTARFNTSECAQAAFEETDARTTHCGTLKLRFQIL